MYAMSNVPIMLRGCTDSPEPMVFDSGLVYRVSKKRGTFYSNCCNSFIYQGIFLEFSVVVGMGYPNALLLFYYKMQRC